MKLTRVVPAVAAMALLAACSPTAGTAVVIDGTAISEAHLSSAIEACKPILGPELSRGAVVHVLIMGAVFDKMIESLGQPVTDEQLDELANEMYPATGTAMLASEGCREVGLAAIKNELLPQVDAAAAMTALRSLDVQMNPRYGKFTPSEEGLFVESGSLSVPSTDAVK
ncbi:MAG: hypothetical protein QM713_12525 [Arachnia sp.]